MNYPFHAIRRRRRQVVAGGVSDVATDFGALTAEGFGGVAVTGTSISSGDASTHWQIVSGKISPTAAGDTANLNLGPYSLVLNNDQTVDISIIAGAASGIVGGAGAAVGQAVINDDGRTILLRPGDYGEELSDANLALKNRTTHSNRFTISAHDTNDKPLFDLIGLRNSDLITLDNLHVDGSAGNLMKIINGSGSTWAKRIIIQNCVISGPLGTIDVYDPVYDPDYAAWPTYGITTSSGSSPPDYVELRDNTIRYVKTGILMSGLQEVEVVGNDISFNYGDALKFGGGSVRTLISWNTMHHPLASNADPSAPHVDGIQFAGGASVSHTGIEITGNRIWHGGSRGGNWQGIFMSDKLAGFYFDGAVIRYNIIQTNTVVWGIVVSQAKDTVVYGNLGLGDPDTVGGSTTLISIGADTTSGVNTAHYNIGEGVAVAGTTDEVGNISIGLNGANLTPADYDTAFVGTAYAVTTLEDLMAVFAFKVGGPLDGITAQGGDGVYQAGSNNPLVDYDARTAADIVLDVGFAVDEGSSTGTFSTSGIYRIWTAEDGDDLVVTSAGDVDAIVVGGGGSGGNRQAGGGGAGEYVERLTGGTQLTLTAATHAAVVGAGATAASSVGSNSTFGGLTALGGGGGGTRVGTLPSSGGSGGGSGTDQTTPGTSIASDGVGFDGQRDNANTTYGGGGGGATGTPARAASNIGGDGGDGIASPVPGESGHYAGGGGAGAEGVSGLGGLGGGGDGADAGVVATVGTPGTGGGGGGGSNSSRVHADGGSGTIKVWWEA